MTNLVYQKPGTVTTWQDSGGTLAMSLNGLVSGTGRQGAQLDRGTTARPALYRWRAWVQFKTPPVVGEVVEVYMKTGDGTVYDNDDGIGNIAVSAKDKLRNCTPLQSIIVDEAALLVPFSAKGNLYLTDRYFLPILWVTATDDLEATANVSGFSLIEMPDEIQDAP